MAMITGAQTAHQVAALAETAGVDAIALKCNPTGAAAASRAPFGAFGLV